MQTIRILQASALILIVAFTTGCASTNQYVSKLFSPRSTINKDTQYIAIKFLELDRLDADKQSWIKTDITKIKDSITEPSSNPVIAETRTIPLPDEPVAKTTNPDGTRTKRSRE